MAACATRPQAPVEAAAVPAYRVVGYYAGWATAERQFPPARVDTHRLTHINYAFAVIADGVVALRAPKTDPNNIAALQALKQSNPALKTLISIGGWADSKYFSDVAATAEARARFADSVVTFIQHYGFDGVDIDWEYPVAGGDAGNHARPEDRENYTLLLAALRHALDQAGQADGGRHYLLTSATGASTNWLANTDMREVSRVLDWVNLMSYDFSGNWNKVAGHVAPLFTDPAAKSDEAAPPSSVSAIVAQYEAAGVPANKITLGLAFYGYAWKGCKSDQRGEYQPCEAAGIGSWGEAGEVDFADIDHKLVDKAGFTRHWNAVTHTPYLFNPVTREFVTYEDATSMADKLTFIEQHHLGGAMAWELSSDRDGKLLGQVAARLLRQR
ncbi:MAG: glycoside hydrolase family 18 protein [Burkholderiales bacterium]|nr:glycoside hydrolase family 18 protein [Burkholderiales bacterium]